MYIVSQAGAVIIATIKGTPCTQSTQLVLFHHAHCNGSPDTPSSCCYFPRLLSITLALSVSLSHTLTSHPIILSSKTCVYFPASVIIATAHNKDFDALTLYLSSSKLRVG